MKINHKKIKEISLAIDSNFSSVEIVEIINILIKKLESKNELKKLNFSSETKKILMKKITTDLAKVIHKYPDEKPKDGSDHMLLIDENWGCASTSVFYTKEDSSHDHSIWQNADVWIDNSDLIELVKSLFESKAESKKGKKNA